MVNYKIILNDFKELADKHKMINSFGTGDLSQLIYLTSNVEGQNNDSWKAPIYPLMFVIPKSVNRGEQQITYPFDIVIADIMNTKNYDIETDLLSDTLEIAEHKLKKWRYMIQSMTKEEKLNPKILKSSRIKRISKGSGTTEREVKELLKQYNAMKKLMKSFGKRRLPPIFKKIFDKTG